MNNLDTAGAEAVGQMLVKLSERVVGLENEVSPLITKVRALESEIGRLKGILGPTIGGVMTNGGLHDK